MTTTPRIVITPGEPAGIGPDIVVQLAQLNHAAELIVIADPDLMTSRAKLLGLPLTLNEWDASATKQAPGTLKIIPVPLNKPCVPGTLDTENSSYVIRTLECATDLCLQNNADAIVTGPVQKSIIIEAGIPFSGHTEFFAERCQVQHVIMLFVADEMKVALATTHIPLNAVPNAITKDGLRALLRLLNTELKKQFHLQQPKILVCGLNPHAGEHGHLGHEEINIIKPVIDELISENIHLTGPLAADTIFTEKYLQTADAIVAMYHDQALPVVKYLGFGRTVNVTLGLPFVRTSVDHGTALDVAGTLKANPKSLMAATHLAIKMC